MTITPTTTIITGGVKYGGTFKLDGLTVLPASSAKLFREDHFNGIHVLQKMVLRLIMNVPNLTHSAPLFNQCGILPIQNSFKFLTVTTVYKSLNGLTPDYMKNMFEQISNITTRSTCLSTTNSLYISKRNLCVSRRALPNSGATLYNTVDLSTQSCSSLSSFKHRTFKHIM